MHLSYRWYVFLSSFEVYYAGSLSFLQQVSCNIQTVVYGIAEKVRFLTTSKIIYYSLAMIRVPISSRAWSERRLPNGWTHCGQHTTRFVSWNVFRIGVCTSSTGVALIAMNLVSWVNENMLGTSGSLMNMNYIG